jgi:hypothetical protein
MNRALTINRGRLPPGILEAIHLSMMNDAAALHPLIMPAPDDLSCVNQDRPDRNSALLKSLPCFRNRSLKIRVHRIVVAGIGDPGEKLALPSKGRDHRSRLQ